MNIQDLRQGIPMCLGGASLVATSGAVIGVAVAGLLGGISVTAVSAVALGGCFFNPITCIPQLIVSILGLTGVASMGVVSGVTIGMTSLPFLIGLGILIAGGFRSCGYLRN